MVKRTYNTFNNGMGMDIDKLSQPNSSYRYSLNGRLVFNKDGTYSWVNEKGNKLSFIIDADSGGDANTYVPIGACSQSNLLVLFSVDAVNNYGEIGIVTFDANGIGTYKTLFNDQNDPNGDLFNFKPYNQIEARFVYESDELIRVYWVDGVSNDSNRPRVFTFKYDNTIGPPTDTAAYSAVTTSVHNTNSQSDFNMGIIKYVQTISGNLLTGVYQYTYRLVTSDGYQTPWYPLSRNIFITSDAVSNTNWNEYEMEGSGITTSKGNRITIKGIDTRFVEIEVAYVYTQSSSAPFEANIFTITSISGDTMTFDHVSNDGEPLELTTIPAIFQGIRAAKTLNIKDQTLYYGNIVEGLFDIDADTVLANVTCTPIFKDMLSDAKDFTDVPNPPVTHSATITGTTTVQMHDDVGGTENYDIIGDYQNYKGTQVSHLYEGYFRGETYRFGIVFFDLLGFPSFVYHLADVTFPDQYQDTYAYSRIASDGTIVTGTPVALSEKAWATNNYGDYTSPVVLNGNDSSLGTYSYIRIMGIEFSGIDISSIKSSISGFQIVRCKLDKTIIAQGLLMPCVRQNDITRPQPSANQHWYDFFVGGNPDPSSDPGDIELVGLNMLGVTQPTTNSGVTSRYLIRPNISAFYAPNFDFSPSSLPALQSQDEIKIIGGCWQDANPDYSAPATAAECNYFTYADHCMQKLFNTKNNNHLSTSMPYPEYGDSANMTQLLNLGLGSVTTAYVPGLDLDNSIEFEDQDFAGFSDGFELKGWGKPNTTFLVHDNFTSGSYAPFYLVNPGSTPWTGYFIANYKRPNASPYGGQTLSALEQNIFIPTGHFQPVNNASFTAPTGDIYNGVQVFGGDCYLDYFGFLRIYPRYWGQPNPGSSYGDCAYGHVFPLESEINHTLRQASSEQNPMYTDVGSRPNAEFDTPGSTSWPDGLFYDSDTNALFEEFNYSAALLYQETISLYNPKPLRFVESRRRPVRWRYSMTKFYGEPIDQWRIFQVNDFYDLNATYGEITSSYYMMNQIYSWQKGAFGRLRASDRALIESATAGSLTTGLGGKLDGIDYISTVSGNQHQWSLFGSDRAAYWVNVDLLKICRFAQDGYVELSDVRGLHQWCEKELPYFSDNDQPIYGTGICGVFDQNNKDAIFSFVRNRTYTGDTFTLVDQYNGISDEILLEDDDLLYVTYTGDPLTDNCVIPVGNTTNGTNNLLNFYIYVDALSADDMPVHLYTTTSTLLFTATAGAYYRIYRNNINDAFIYELLDAAPSYKQYKTLKYNEQINRFVTFGSSDVNFFASTMNLVLSYNNQLVAAEREMYLENSGIRNSYYGVDHYSLIDIISAPESPYAKIYDNLFSNINNEGKNNLINVLMYCDSMFYNLPLTSDNRVQYREDKLRFPLRTVDQTDRMRGKHIRLLMEFTNDLNREVRLTNTETLYRLSARL
jgi:hypothetical protein